MYPAFIEVDTRLNSGASTGFRYDIPLNMRLFHRFNGIPEEPFLASIGVISNTGTGDRSFSFVPDEEVIATLKPLQKQSVVHYAAGESPILKSESPTRVAAEEAQLEPESDPVEPVGEQLQDALEQSEMDVALVTGEEERVIRQQVQLDQLEEAQTIQRDKLQQAQKEEHFSDETHAAAKRDELIERKYIQQAHAYDQQLREEEIADARAVQYQRRGRYQATEMRTSSTPSQRSLQLIEHQKEDGFWVNQERLLIEENGQRNWYSRTAYDWVFMEYVAYHKDDIEIEKEEYEQLLEKLGI